MRKEKRGERGRKGRQELKMRGEWNIGTEDSKAKE